HILLDGSTPQVFAQADVLKATYIQPPQITQLFQGMDEYSLPKWVRTTTEAYKILTSETIEG
ncbi:MAG: hypothetical protein KAR20_01310, partial [Candidatus Heimdallarchaeota archaeon]|nr:hypothetical protein [Candidatus Heimdallarchaeota archaeon]